jgi:hypothetical protein
MLPTIEVEIDAKGVIHPLEPLPGRGKMRGLLTILDSGEPEKLLPDYSDEGIESLFGIVKANRAVSLEDMWKRPF